MDVCAVIGRVACNIQNIVRIRLASEFIDAIGQHVLCLKVPLQICAAVIFPRLNVCPVCNFAAREVERLIAALRLDGVRTVRVLRNAPELRIPAVVVPLLHICAVSRGAAAYIQIFPGMQIADRVIIRTIDLLEHKSLAVTIVTRPKVGVCTAFRRCAVNVNRIILIHSRLNDIHTVGKARTGRHRCRRSSAVKALNGVI